MATPKGESPRPVDVPKGSARPDGSNSCRWHHPTPEWVEPTSILL